MKTGLEKRWFEFFKGGFYSQGWEMIFDPAQTEAEVEAVIELLDLPPGSHVLDWCGGWGRHSIELAKRGFQVTLLDYAPNHIELARSTAKEEGVDLNLICQDFRETPTSIQADFAINLFTSGLGYLTMTDDLKALKSLHGALKPGARLMVDTMSVYWLARNFQSHGWRQTEGGGVKLLSNREFDFLTSTIISQDILLVAGKGEKNMNFEHRIFSPTTLTRLLGLGGFETTALCGGYDGSEFAFDSRRILMISERRFRI